MDSAGEEERFPWRLAPIRALAILATVGSGAAMGTEAPAAYLGVAAGACLGDRGRWWRRLLRPAALAGGAAGVAALMAIPLVGTAFMLELGRRRRAPLSAERVMAALIGGLVGWGINVAFHLNLIRLVVPKEPPESFLQAVITALFIGARRAPSAPLAGVAIYRAKKWQASPVVRLALGGAATVVTALVLARIAAPSAAVGPGGGAILWAETRDALPLTLLAVCLLRAVATTAAVAAGGCGGVFVPFLAIGDLAGRVFAPGLGVGNDLAGAAGAAGGIAGGYRLPFTAVAMVLGRRRPAPGDADLPGHRGHRLPRRRGRRVGARQVEERSLVRGSRSGQRWQADETLEEPVLGELVVQRAPADLEAGGGLRLVALLLDQHPADHLHLELVDAVRSVSGRLARAEGVGASWRSTSATVRRSLSDRMTIRSMQCCSSRMFPGQA